MILVLASLVLLTPSVAAQTWTLMFIDDESRVETLSTTEAVPASTADFAGLPSNSAFSRCTPVGLEIDHDTGIILCSESNQPQAWFVSVHEDWNSLQDEVDALIRSGHQPLDLSRDGTAVAMVWTESADPAPSWRLSSCVATTPVLTRAIHEYGNRGYQLAGLSAHDGLFWLLFSKSPPGTQSSAVVSIRTGDLHSDQTLDRTAHSIQSARISGWTLSGLATSDGSLHLLVSPAP